MFITKKEIERGAFTRSLTLFLMNARISNDERRGQLKMGILNWLSKKYLGSKQYEDADFPYDDWEDLCINKCHYAVLGNHNKHYCFINKHELRSNSIIHGCMRYASKGVISGNILCPNCKSDLVERTSDHRFKCAGCGSIFS